MTPRTTQGRCTTCRASADCTGRPRSSRSPCSPPRGPPASPAWASAPPAPTPTARGTLPDGTVLPTAAIEAPASVGDRGRPAPPPSPPARPAASRRPRSSPTSAPRPSSTRPTSGCNLPWELIAAIGRVESDHGRFGGNALDDEGVARPGIYGIALNGKNDTQDIADTDAGQYDDDTRFDRAVGPMQFIPSTWSVVGVDGDSDGTRNPQDIDDAALATAVYLCSGDDDLSDGAGPARHGLPLQPLQRLRRPGAGDHAGLPGRRLQRRAHLARSPRA